MNNLENWTEVTKGLYRYVIVPNCCYEIHILYKNYYTDILMAKASLYLAAKWFDPKNKTSFFERECLLAEQPVSECLKAAVNDDKENNSHDQII